MTESASIYKGDTGGPWRVGHRLDDGTLATLPGAYTCKIKVSGTAIDRAVTDVGPDTDGTANKRFIAALTPAETLTLAAGQYVVAVEVENTGVVPPLRVETHIILTVEDHVVGSSASVSPPSEADLLRTELAQVRAGRIALMTGGVVQKVRNGRYATEMWYATASLSDYNMMIATLEREIAAADRIASGGTRRSAISVVWN